jgi:hypothetical protein
VNRRASWHAACVAAWKLWTAPHDHVQPLKRRQKRRCLETGKRLLKGAEVDHRTPLYRVWRERREEAWPGLLDYWGVPNLQVINRDAHRAKCAAEAGDRADAAREGADRAADQGLATGASGAGTACATRGLAVAVSTGSELGTR